MRGIFAVIDESGNLAGKGRTEEKRLLPGQRGKVTAQWAQELRPGRYTAVVSLSYNRAGLEAATLVYEIPFVAK